jgi:hypothetical protein
MYNIRPFSKSAKRSAANAHWNPPLLKPDVSVAADIFSQNAYIMSYNLLLALLIIRALPIFQ